MWLGDYSMGTGVLEFMADGSFEQWFFHNGTVIVSGTGTWDMWENVPAGLDPRRIDVKGLLEPVDYDRSLRKGSEVRRVNTEVIACRPPPTLILNPDSRAQLTKLRDAESLRQSANIPETEAESIAHRWFGEGK